MIMFGTYLRLHVPVHADWRAVIRHCFDAGARRRRDPSNEK